ncbi:hypothetical protein CSC3H3_01050 [Thalassospira marina]|uniref:Uncharacterized protein n=1 Tax=Thalassospira marina TaxID=2048283 RepID=A0ABM6Q4S7_9PROT|nr:hypothetical protein CSC3H3_01050 [Thalassospira marina]
MQGFSKPSSAFVRSKTGLPYEGQRGGGGFNIPASTGVDWCAIGAVQPRFDGQSMVFWRGPDGVVPAKLDHALFGSVDGG